MHKSGPVAIVGGGIAGLTAALSFARKGVPSHIFEQTKVLSEVGAGLQISPNASRILEELGVLSALEARWSEPDRVSLVSGLDLKPLANVPSGSGARRRWRAPYGVLHRASLQSVLLDAVTANPLCTLHFGTRLTSEEFQTEIALTIGQIPRLIVGADGVWSQLRHAIPRAGEARFSGNIAWRFTLPAATALPVLDQSRVTAFVGPKLHLVAYPLKEFDTFNIVAITRGRSAGENWDASDTVDSRQSLLARCANWHPDLQAILRGATASNLWPLYEVSKGKWQDGKNLVLIGDAAHAMMPFAAQGAAMAIEDAFELAAFVNNSSSLDAFETYRKARIARVHARATFNRFAYHAAGPVRIARDMILSLRKPEQFAADFDWLYGYEPKD